MIDHISLWRRYVGPAVVVLALVPMFASGCGYDRTRRTDLQSDGTVIRYWPGEWSPVVVEPKPVPIADAEYEYTFPRFRDVDELWLFARLLRDGSPVPESELDTPNAKKALDSIRVATVVRRTGTTTPIVDTATPTWGRNGASSSERLILLPSSADAVRPGPMVLFRGASDHGSTHWTLTVTIDDDAAVREVCDQIQFVLIGELPMSFWQL